MNTKPEDLSLTIDNTEIERIGNDCKANYFKFVGVHMMNFYIGKITLIM